MSRPIETGRRAFLGTCAVAAPMLAGCDQIASLASELLGDGIPASFEAPRETSIDPWHHLVSRTSFGPRPGDLETARRMGREAFLDRQLEPSGIDDTACELRTGMIDGAHLPASLLFELPPEQIEEEVGRFALLRAVYSKRQLYEVMVELWSDHFHVAIGKSLCRHLRPADYRDVARRHALGSFRELLGASALSPAMLVYLDGRDNKRRSAADQPNENYARELFELHTLGVHGGYTQADVMAAARCLTGFVVKEEWAPGQVEFVPELHDDGPKTILGHTIPAGGGRGDVDRLLDIVATHPSTARRIAEKLCRTFVSDDPPADLVASAAGTFSTTAGDIRAVVRSILLSDELTQARGAKVKRPFRFVASALRSLGADTHAKEGLVAWLGRMGHAPFAWPTPDGYPDRGEPWLSTLVTRFRFAFELTNDGIGGTRADIDRLAAAVAGDDKSGRLAAHLFGRAPTSTEMIHIANGRSTREAIAMAIASPAFQRF